MMMELVPVLLNTIPKVVEKVTDVVENVAPTDNPCPDVPCLCPNSTPGEFGLIRLAAIAL